jgi:hypothetical protein
MKISNRGVTAPQHKKFLAESRRLNRLLEARQNMDMLVESTCSRLPLREQPVMKNLYLEWKNIGDMIAEANLTSTQINQIFSDAEQQMTASGANRNLTGKIADLGSGAVGAITQGLVKVRDAISSTGPVSGFDVGFNKIQQALVKKLQGAVPGQSNNTGSAVLKALDAWKTIGTKYPVTQGVLYAGMIMLSGLSAAGLPGIAIVAGIKTVDGLIKGKKFSTAVMDTLPGAAISWIMQHLPSSTVPEVQAADTSGVSVDDTSGLSRASDDTIGGSTSGPQPDDTSGLSRASDDTIGGSTSGEQPGDAAPVGTPLTSQLEKIYGEPIKNYDGSFSQAFAAARKELGAGKLFHWGDDVYPTNMEGKEDFFYGFSPEVKKALQQGLKEAAYTLTVLPYAKLVDVNRTAHDIRENSRWEMHPTCVHLSHAGVRNVFENTVGLQNYLIEAGFWKGVGSALKKGAKAVAGGIEKVGKFAGQVGHSMTNKVTVDKLLMNWKVAGSPTDSAELLRFLLKQGVSRQIISAIYKKMGIPITEPMPSPSPTPTTPPTQPGDAGNAMKDASSTPQGRAAMLAALEKILATL